MALKVLTQRWQERRDDVVAFAIIGIFFLAIFGPVIVQGKFFLILDSTVELMPERYAAWQSIRQGTLPLWTPLILSGYPLFSMAQIGLAYPLTWGYLFLPPYWAEEIYVIAPYLLAPAFTYAYGRYIGRSWLASLIAGLAYGYGGAMMSTDIHNGLLTNATMWLPLFLIAIEQARRKRAITSWLWLTAAYTASVLTGYGQGFLIVGGVGLAYAGWLALIARRIGGWFTLNRWRPLFLTIAAIAGSVGIASFQIFETMRAQRRSIRATLTFEGFSEFSTPLGPMFKSLMLPFQGQLPNLFVCAHLSPIALVLALYAAIRVIRRRDNDPYVWFWILLAVIGWFLMLGINTPVYRSFYYIPILNKFKQPIHYAVIWTFAVSMLAAYGWDYLEIRWSHPVRWLSTNRRTIIWATIAFGLTLLTALLFWRAVRLHEPESIALLFKILLTAFIVMALWLAKKTGRRWRTLLLTGCLALACFVEPFILVSVRWWPRTRTSQRLTTPAEVTRFLQPFPAPENRVFTYAKLFSEDLSRESFMDSQNMSMMHGLQNVAGYEPLMLQRYNHALGDVWLDSVTPLKEPPDVLFRSDSHVLDLLNNTYLVTHSSVLDVPTERNGITFLRIRDVDSPPGDEQFFWAQMATADTVAIVSMMSGSIDIAQGTPVATVTVRTSNGLIIERPLRAGVDTAEWAHERVDVRPIVRHGLAPIFETNPGDPENSFPAYTYLSLLHLGKTETITAVSVRNITRGPTLVISGLTLYDSSRAHSTPLAQPAVTVDLNKWQPVYSNQQVMVLKNNRVLPRAWLVAEAEAVDGDEAFLRISGRSHISFDPRRTALLEVEPKELPQLPGGPMSTEGTATVSAYEANRLTVDTDSPTAAVLVVSEINYPGWVADVDGVRTPIQVTDFLLRGVVVPAGKHRVEMRYLAPPVRNGAIISSLTLLVMLGALVYARRYPG